MVEEEAQKDESRLRHHWPLIRILIAAGFAFSCFGLLLFVWTTFGGVVPLKAKSYRFTADFAEGHTLQTESDVRIGGVSVGKVKETSLPPDGNATRATIEIEPAFAPISTDARAILRQKTLLGETYIELTGGTQNRIQAEAGSAFGLAGDEVAEPIPEDGHLDDSQVVEQVQIDEIFNALDEETRLNFRSWQQNLAVAGKGRGLDLSDAFGNIGPFAGDATDLIETLNRQEQALSTLVNETGTVFSALTERDRQLTGLIEGNERTFGALADRDEQLAEAIKIFPTFNREAEKTLRRVEDFSVNAQPLARDLKPVARNLTPTLRDVRRLAPHAKRLFSNLDPLITSSERGLPALRGVLREARPALSSLDPFLANLNPIIRYTGMYSGNVTDFLSDPETTQVGTLTPLGSQPSARHVFRQISYISPESLSIYPTRLATNRGNAYLPPNVLGTTISQEIRFPSHDCDNTGATGGLGAGQVTKSPPSTPPQSPGIFPLSITPTPGVQAMAACVLPPPFPAEFGGGIEPRILADP